MSDCIASPSASLPTPHKPTHLDLCSGIGGFALAAQWSGYDTIGFCEIDPWCRRVLGKNFPGVPQHDDLWTLTGDLVRDWIEMGAADVRHPASARRDEGEPGEGTALRIDARGSQFERRDSGGSRTLDLITGGYPCQPFSLAGKRLGAEDDRHLWPAIAALVADLRPAKCLFENVAGHITMGLDAVLSDLEALGYACWPVVIPAAAVGAPHRRDRVWILADTDAERRDGRSHDEGQAQAKRTRIAVGSGREALGCMGDPSDGLPGWVVGPDRLNPWAGDWEGDIARTTTHEQDRPHKLKALGNAIVPQVAYEILRAQVTA